MDNVGHESTPFSLERYDVNNDDYANLQAVMITRTSSGRIPYVTSTFYPSKNLSLELMLAYNLVMTRKVAL